MLVPNSNKVSALVPKSPDIKLNTENFYLYWLQRQTSESSAASLLLPRWLFPSQRTIFHVCCRRLTSLTVLFLFSVFFLGSHQVIHLLTHSLASPPFQPWKRRCPPGVAGIKRPCEPCAAVQPWRVSDCLPNLPWQIDRCTGVAVRKWNRSFMEYKVKLGSVWGEHGSSAGAAAVTRRHHG